MKNIAAMAWMIVAMFGSQAVADEPSPADATALPFAAKLLSASTDECAVWRRERSFAQSVEAHDAAAFVAHLHAGAVFSAGIADADRGRDEVVKSWAAIVEGKSLVLRWRPGIVMIGGDPNVAVSRGPYIVQTTKDSVATFTVGFYQTIWLRDASNAIWRVLFDGGASTPTKVADRTAAETWVTAQTMSDCLTSTKP